MSASNVPVESSGAPEHTSSLTQEVAARLRQVGQQGHAERHAAMRYTLRRVMDAYPSGRNKQGLPMTIAWEEAPSIDPAKYDSPEGVPLWIRWAAQTLTSAQIGPGITQCTFQFRSSPDPNRGGQPRLDIWLLRKDGTVITCHPGKTAARSAKPVVYAPGKLQP